MKIKTLEIAGFRSALHGMRNPMNSWKNSDSKFYCDYPEVEIGENDLNLAKKLIKAGAEHRKFLRTIQVWADFTMPRYWWQEADTYHFGTKNSCSTMHKLTEKEFTKDDFQFISIPIMHWYLEDIIESLNELREYYLKTNDYQYVIMMKQLLPESYLQTRTWNTNYEEIRNIYFQRKNHRLKEEWVETFCRWAETLPYFKELCIDTNESL